MFIDVSDDSTKMMNIPISSPLLFLVHAGELEGIKDETARFRRLVERNAMHSAETLCNSTIVQNAWKRGQKLSVHAWAYDLADG